MPATILSVIWRRIIQGDGDRDFQLLIANLFWLECGQGFGCHLSLYLSLPHFFAQIYWHFFCIVNGLKPFSKITESVIWIAVDFLRVRLRLREVIRIVVREFLSLAVDNVQIFFLPEIRPVNSNANIRDKLSARIHAASYHGNKHPRDLFEDAEMPAGHVVMCQGNAIVKLLPSNIDCSSGIITHLAVDVIAQALLR